MARRIAVTGAGGVGGVNFVRAAREAEELFIVGLDNDEYYLQLPKVDVRVPSPRHDDPRFIEVLKEVVERHGVEFIHPQPEVEVEVVAAHRQELKAKTLLPSLPAVEVARDKWRSYRALREAGVNAPEAELYSAEAVERLLGRHGRVWIRARRGAGGRLSLPVGSVEEAEAWVKLWRLRGAAEPHDFMVQEYLPGRDVAWDSLWFEGRLVASYARERLRYIFPHLAPSRVTGTPTVARVVRDRGVNEVAEAAVKAVDPSPNGFYCVDLKYDSKGRPAVTEVNAKAHTTLGLWSFLAHRVFGLPKHYNMVWLYIKLGLEGEVDELPERYDIYPEATLIRHIDSGLLVGLGGEWRRVEG